MSSKNVNALFWWSGQLAIHKPTANCALCRSAAEVFVAAGDEGFDFEVGDGAFEHPESAVGVHPANTTVPVVQALSVVGYR